MPSAKAPAISEQRDQSGDARHGRPRLRTTGDLRSGEFTGGQRPTCEQDPHDGIIIRENGGKILKRNLSET